MPTSSHSLEECCSNVVSADRFVKSTIKDPWSPGVAMGLINREPREGKLTSGNLKNVKFPQGTPFPHILGQTIDRCDIQTFQGSNFCVVINRQ